jgi:hypothetical protein
VSQYYFIAKRANQNDDIDPRAVILPDDAAALRFAERMIAELRKEKGYFNSIGYVTVKNEKKEVILSVPFLPACA